MLSAFLTLPLVYVSYKFENKADLITIIIQTVITLSGAVLFTFIVLYLMKFINAFFKFHSVDRNLMLLIVANIVVAVLTLVAIYFTQLKESIEYAVLTIVVAQGIVQIQLGYKLLKLPNDLGGMLKPFCYANIATGVLMASIFLIPLGIVASAVSDLMLGTIFLNMGTLVQNYESVRIRS
jgi:hypothetical protein